MEPEKKANGALIGLIIIILVLLVGGVYIWQQSRAISPIVPAEEDLSQEELDALEADLNSVETGVDVDINSVE